MAAALRFSGNAAMADGMRPRTRRVRGWPNPWGGSRGGCSTGSSRCPNGTPNGSERMPTAALIEYPPPVDTKPGAIILEDLIDELARVIHESESARVLVLRARFPAADLPAFDVPRVFWSRVIRAAADGKLVGGVRALVDEVAKQYPGNEVFTGYRTQAMGPVPLSAGTSPPRASEERPSFLERAGIDNRGASIGQMVMVQGSATFGPTTITMPSPSPAPSSGAAPIAKTAKPAVILLCTANAAHPNHRLRLEEELRAIDDALQRARRRDLYAPRMCPAVTFSKVIHELDDHEPAFVHFSGHGAPSGDLILKGERSEELLVPPARIAELLEAVPKSPTLVTFATCHSRALAEAAAQHAEFAIGFDGALDDDSAPLFSAMLYERLASREEVDVERAFKLATIACKAEGHATVELARLFAYPGRVVGAAARAPGDILPTESTVSNKGTPGGPAGHDRAPTPTLTATEELARAQLDEMRRAQSPQLHLMLDQNESSGGSHEGAHLLIRNVGKADVELVSIRLQWQVDAPNSNVNNVDLLHGQPLVPAGGKVKYGFRIQFRDVVEQCMKAGIDEPPYIQDAPIIGKLVVQGRSLVHGISETFTVSYTRPFAKARHPRKQ